MTKRKHRFSFGLTNRAENSDVIQIGLRNYAKDCGGLQIGIYNRSDEELYHGRTEDKPRLKQIGIVSRAHIERCFPSDLGPCGDCGGIKVKQFSLVARKSAHHFDNTRSESSKTRFLYGKMDTGGKSDY